MAFRVGVQTRKQAITAYALGAICVIALILVIRFLWGYFSPGPAAPVTATSAPALRSTTAAAALTPVPSASMNHQATRLNTTLDPTLHPELMLQAESMTYSGRGRNIFSQNSLPLQSAIPKPKFNPRPVSVVQTGPPPPQPPPVIDLKFYGYSAAKMGAKKAFLLHGEDIFIAAEGDVVDRRYRLLKIEPFSVQVEDLAYKNTQTLRLIQN